MESTLIELQDTLQRQGILISFSGRFSQGIIEELGDAVKKYLETESLSQNDTHSVFSIFIEQTQNIKNYSAAKNGCLLGEKIANSGIVMIGKSETGHFVSSGNMLERKDADILIEILDEINILDQATLKKRYKEQMRKAIGSGNTGAGLGLMDMARKASCRLEYSIKRLDEELCFFTLKVYI